MTSIEERIARLSPEQRAVLLRKLARARTEPDRRRSPIQPIARTSGTVGLSFTQERIWFLDQFAPGNPVHTISGVATVPLPVDPEAFRACLDELVDRHEILRTRFDMVDGEPRGIVLEHATVPVRVLDVSDDEAERAFRADAVAAFDLRNAPPMRVTLVPRPSECLIQLSMHHIVSDGFSTAVVFRELGELYQARLTHRLPELPALDIQFADYAAWERGRFAAADGLVAYWRERLADAPRQLALPADRSRPNRMTYRGGRVEFEVPAELAERARAAAAAHGVTVFVTMLAVYVVVLQRYCLQDDLVVGVPVANRETAGAQELIGPFLNTIPVRCDLAGNPTFADVVAALHRVVIEGFEHQAVPLDKILQTVDIRRDPGRSPLYQTVFNFQFDRSGSAQTPGIRLRDLPNGTCQFDILINLVSGATGLAGHVDYYADAYSESWIRDFIDSYLTVLDAVVSDGRRPVREVGLLSADRIAAVVAHARRSVLAAEWHSAPAQIVEQSRQTPDAAAVICGGQTLTYRELDLRSVALATRLRARVDAEPGAHVGICAERSLDVAVAVLAVLRSGYAYVPLDPAYPAERLAFVAADARLVGLLADPAGRAALPDFDGPILDVAEDAAPPPAAGRPAEVAADSGAYTIYTSGSTGAPKGVRVTHGNVGNFLESMRAQPGIAMGDVLLAVTSLSFDISVLELLLPLTTGAAVVVAERADLTDGRRLAGLIARHGVTIMQATPATWQLLVDGGWAGTAGLRMLCGGEALTPTLADTLLARGGELWNMYGPTETTIWSLIHRVTEPDATANAIPIGRPIRNTQAFVLDEGGNPLPVGARGELYLGGAGVAAGYHERPLLTAERFIPAPFDPSLRLYRTGDLVARRRTGELEFFGRLDHQVKLRGFRIELGEIDNTLTRHELVRRCATVATDPGLVAYVEPVAEAAEIRDQLPDTLREWLRQRLPEHAIPARIVPLDTLPLTPNGKIDRKSLPDPSDTEAVADGGAPAGHVAPRTEAEQRMAALWADLLERAPIGVEDDFFEAGGHSLLATKLVFRIREAFDAELPLHVLFDGKSTVARMVAMVEKVRAGEDAADAADVQLDLAAEARLDPAIRPDPTAHVHSVTHPQHPLLTGATGFVGAFLLAELLATTDATVFCLVRATSETEGLERIRAALVGYGIWADGYESRIVVVLGDLSRPALGLSRPQWHHLCQMVDVIYHNGATVNFLRSYHALAAANVRGTTEILRLACDGPVKPVHFVSTTYVFSRFAYPPGTEFTERMDPHHDLEYTFGYTQSKWVSERLVAEAGKRGLPVYIYRPGRVAGHSRTGACQTYDFVWQATKVAIEMGVAPIMDMTVDITPVDYVVGALVHLSRQRELAGESFHLVSPDPVPEPELVDWIGRHGYLAARLPFGDWCTRVVERAAELSDTTSGALAPFLSGTLPLDRIPHARFDTHNVERGLRGTDLSCPPIDDTLLRRYFDYFVQTGYIPAPVTASAGEQS